MARADLRYELQGNQRLAARDGVAGEHANAGHFVYVFVAAPEAAGGAVGRDGEGLALIMITNVARKQRSDNV